MLPPRGVPGRDPAGFEYVVAARESTQNFCLGVVIFESDLRRQAKKLEFQRTNPRKDISAGDPLVPNSAPWRTQDQHRILSAARGNER